MDNKIIFLDVDGTLVSSNQKVSKKVKEAILKAKENKHLVFLCTGRNKARTQFFDFLMFDGIICSNGSYIQIGNKIIFDYSYSNEELEEIQDLFKKKKIEYNLRGNQRTFSTNKFNEYIMKMMNLTNSEYDNIVNESEQTDYVSSIEMYNESELIKTIFFICEQSAFDSLNVNEKYKIIKHAAYNGYVMAEINPSSVSKKQGILKIIEYLNIDIKDTICFGDGMNDIEMLELCHHSVAMQNASDEVKKHAKYVCESVENDGIYHELKRLNLI